LKNFFVCDWLVSDTDTMANCKARTKAGTQCARRAVTELGFCRQHDHTEFMKRREAEVAAAAAAAAERESEEMKQLATTLDDWMEVDAKKQIAEDTILWRWVPKRNAFCQLRKVGDSCEIAHVCHCPACMNDMDRQPVIPKHCSCCACRDCVCPARRETRCFVPNAGPVTPYWDSACQCDQCLGDVYADDYDREGDRQYCPCHYGHQHDCALWMMFNKDR